MSSLEDESLQGDRFDKVLGEARRGDRRAFERLYLALSRRVHAFARVRGNSDPGGIVNEVFLQVFTGLGRFEGSEAQFKAWVFRIARNKLIDESRRRQRRPVEVSDDYLPHSSLSGSDDVEGEVMSNLADESVIARLHLLTDEQRDVLLLRLVSGLPIDLIAEILGKQPGAVKALQRRALRNIARDFSPEPVPR